MTAPDPDLVATYAAAAATAVGFVMWIMAVLFSRDPIRRMRLLDSGMVLIFAAILVRFVVQERPLNAIEWVLAALSPVFIAAALYRLWRTERPPVEDDR